MFVTVALRARLFYERGRDYLLLGDRVKIVDVATGRLSEARWMRHLHQVLCRRVHYLGHQEHETCISLRNSWSHR